MKIQYSDYDEFLSVLARCKETSKKGECKSCPFFDICDFGEEKMFPAIMENIDE